MQVQDNMSYGVASLLQAMHGKPMQRSIAHTHGSAGVIATELHTDLQC